MTFLFKVEEVFAISGRGCVIVPAIAEGADFKIRPRDAIQLRTPEGRHTQHSDRFSRVLKATARYVPMALLLPPDVVKEDVSKGSDVWLV